MSVTHPALHGGYPREPQDLRQTVLRVRVRLCLLHGARQDDERFVIQVRTRVEIMDYLFLEFEIQQDVICLFSDTLQRAIQKEMISQEMVDLYDPR